MPTAKKPKPKKKKPIKYTVEFYRDRSVKAQLGFVGEWRTRVRHSNGNIVLDSGGDGYDNKPDARNALKNFKNCPWSQIKWEEESE